MAESREFLTELFKCIRTTYQVMMFSLPKSRLSFLPKSIFAIMPKSLERYQYSKWQFFSLR